MGNKISQLLGAGTIAFHLIFRYIHDAPPQRGMALGGIQTDKYMQNKAEACACACCCCCLNHYFYFLFVCVPRNTVKYSYFLYLMSSSNKVLNTDCSQSLSNMYVPARLLSLKKSRAKLTVKFTHFSMQKQRYSEKYYPDQS